MTNVEIVDQDLFEFSDEEEDSDTAETLGQFLTRLTNAEKDQTSFV